MFLSKIRWLLMLLFMSLCCSINYAQVSSTITNSTSTSPNELENINVKLDSVNSEVIILKDKTTNLSNSLATQEKKINEVSKKATELVNNNKINSGDTAWMLTSSLLVLLMTVPGLALFYGGMSRKKNFISTATQVFACTIIVTAIWILFGYSIVFTDGVSILGGFDKAFLNGVIYIKDGNVSTHPLAPTIPEFVFAMFQLTFAIITPALIVGAYVERIKFSTMITFTILWSIFVYAPIAHWVWDPNGWLSKLGALDFAGGLVVHTSSGIAGLVFSLFAGKRHGYGVEPMPPANLVLTMVGAALLWVGWFGFNAGSAGAADGRAAIAMMNTQIGAAFACLGWMGFEWVRRKRPSILGICSGVVAGLVAITPAAGFVNPVGAIIIGLIAGIACYFACTELKRKFQYDDSLDVFGIHGVGGIIGSILTGIFAVKEIGGVSGDVLKQLISVFAVLLYSGSITTVILLVLKLFFEIRVTDVQEAKGLDIAMHGERVE